MRTTVDLDPDVHAAARAIALRDRVSLGQALSRLARAGLKASSRVASDDGIPTFSVSPDAPPITPEAVRQALEEQ